MQALWFGTLTLDGVVVQRDDELVLAVVDQSFVNPDAAGIDVERFKQDGRRRGVGFHLRRFPDRPLGRRA